MKPHNVLIFIACVLACLAVLCFVLPGRITLGERELRWPTMAQVMGEEKVSETEEPKREEEAEEEQMPEQEEQEEREEQVAVVVPKVAVDSVTDSRMFLQAFYASLAESSSKVVRVLHYGDSQIEEDRMSQQIREEFQSVYGGSGCGLMPLAQTIPSLSVRQQLRMNGTTICTPLVSSPRYSQWKVFADSTVHYSFAGDTVVLSGRGAVYGLSQQSPSGVIVDNIPMRGCLGLVFTKMDREQLERFYREENVKLIIMQFGGNAIPSNEKPGTISAIVEGLRDQVAYVRSCAPEASILFIGPSDMMRQRDGEWETYPLVPYMDRLLRKMALDENIAYFSLYRWMGGAGSMKRWQEAGLAGADGVHFHRSGARKAGKAVAEWILEGIEN